MGKKFCCNHSATAAPPVWRRSDYRQNNLVCCVYYPGNAAEEAFLLLIPGMRTMSIVYGCCSCDAVAPFSLHTELNDIKCGATIWIPATTSLCSTTGPPEHIIDLQVEAVLVLLADCAAHGIGARICYIAYLSGHTLPCMAASEPTA